jgi:hypothetical protein
LNDAIYNQLLELARSQPGRLTYYSNIAQLVGLSMDIEEERDKLSLLLWEIVEHEHNNNRPMLTAIVVHRGNDNNPGEGFFSSSNENREIRRIA